jgi:hypothetical protein
MVLFFAFIFFFRSTMPLTYEISVAEDRSYVRIAWHGILDFEHDNPTRLEAPKEAMAHKIHKFLVDVTDAQNQMSISAQRQITYDDTLNLGFDRKAKFAALVRPDDWSYDFMQTMFLGAGYEYQQFTDEKEAIGWLKG